MPSASHLLLTFFSDEKGEGHPEAVPPDVIKAMTKDTDQ